MDPESETVVLEDSTETITAEKGQKHEQPNYVIDVIRRQDNDSWLAQKIIFSRTDLLPDRQLIYDQSGMLATDAHYGKISELQ